MKYVKVNINSSKYKLLITCEDFFGNTIKLSKKIKYAFYEMCDLLKGEWCYIGYLTDEKFYILDMYDCEDIKCKDKYEDHQAWINIMLGNITVNEYKECFKAIDLNEYIKIDDDKIN